MKVKCYLLVKKNIKYEKRARRRHEHCMLAVVRKSPAADPLPGIVGQPKFNHLEMVFRVIVVTDQHTHTHPHTNTQDRLQYTATQLAQCNKVGLRTMKYNNTIS